MELQGKTLMGLLGKRFIIRKDQSENYLEIMCTEPFVQWRDNSDDHFHKNDNGFWRFEWSENKYGESILLLHEQVTPEPLNYQYVVDTDPPFISVLESSYSPTSILIKEVSGYGFVTEREEFLYAIQLETEKEYIYIDGSPGLMEMRISEKELNIYADHYYLMFSTKIK